jgi:prophage tail gpP-like protein
VRRTVPVQRQIFNETSDTFERHTTVAARENGKCITIRLGQSIPASLTGCQNVVATPNADRSVERKLESRGRYRTSIIVAENAIAIDQQAARAPKSRHIPAKLGAMRVKTAIGGGFFHAYPVNPYTHYM